MVAKTPELPTSHPAEWWPGLFEPFRTMGTRISNFFSPQADAAATEEAYEIALELPGVDENDIDITLTDGVLSVKGEKQAARDETGKSFYFMERTYGAFQRSFRLPADVDAEQIKAEFSKGVLMVRLPKQAGTIEQARKIKVRAA